MRSRSQRPLNPVLLLLLADSILVPWIAFRVGQGNGFYRGPAGVSVEPERIRLGQYVQVLAGFGSVAGMAFGLHMFVQRRADLDAAQPLGSAARRRCRRALAASSGIVILRILATSGRDLLASVPLSQLAYFTAPPVMTISALLLLVDALRSTQEYRSLRQWMRVAILAFLVIVPGVSYSLNRAAVILPALALVFVLSRIGLRVKRWHLLLLAIGLLALASTLWNIREERQGGPDHSSLSLSETVQIYGGAPQFQASGAHTMGSTTEDWNILSSVLSPVPLVGGPFRDTSGTVVYNDEVYGLQPFKDQLLLAPAEVFAAAGPGGVVLVFAAIGFLVTALTRRSSPHSISGCYATAIVGFAGALLPISSILSVSQIVVAFALPAFMTGRWLTRHREVPQGWATVPAGAN